MEFKSLKLGKKSLLGVVLGILTGIVLLFNLPSLSSFVSQTLILSIFFGFAGFLIENFSHGKVILAIFGLGTVIGVASIATTNCNAVELIHPPAENSLTGNVIEDGFDGFRFKSCDKERYPWYFNEFDEAETEEYCEINSDSSYCKSFNRREEVK